MSESAFAFNLAPTFSKSVAGLLALTLSFTSSVSFAGHHFYTTSSSEAQQVKTEGFNSEGQEGNVFKFGMGPAGTILLYRLFNPSSGDHLYTTSTSERNTVLAIGWHDEGAVGLSTALHTQTQSRFFGCTAVRPSTISTRPAPRRETMQPMRS